MRIDPIHRRKLSARSTLFLKNSDMRLKPPSNAIIEKVSEKDICNICLNTFSTLSLDHVPPQNSVIQKQLEYRYLFRQDSQWRKSQNGIKFRTICKKCNSEVLGNGYDRDLMSMNWQVRRSLESPLSVPPTAHCHPGRVLRSVLGHLLAAKNHTPRTLPDDAMRAFFRDKTATQVGQLAIHYWVHPDPGAVWMVRDAAVFEFEPGFKGGLCSFLIWYPLGFLVTDTPYNLPVLNPYLSAVGPVSLPLVQLRPGALEEWLNRTGKAVGEPADTSFVGRYLRK